MLAGADPATFRVLDEEWAADANRVYRYGQPEPDLDPAGFTVHGRFQCRGAAVWYAGEPVAGADPATFMFLGGDFGADAAGVYFQGNRVESADRATFTVVRGPFGRDATTTYLGDRPLALRGPRRHRTNRFLSCGPVPAPGRATRPP